MGIARADIRSLDARRPSVSRSVAMAVGIVGAVIVVLTVISGQGS